MKRPSAHVGATVATLLLLAWPEPAHAHVEVRPGLVVQGVETAVTVELPRLRPGSAPERLELEGQGIEVLSTALAGALGPETLWTVRLRADGPPRRAPVILRALYPAGESVEVNEVLTVVPAAEEPGQPWPGIFAGLLVAAALAAVGLRVAARRRA